MSGQPPLHDELAALEVVRSSDSFRSGRVIAVRTDVVRMPDGNDATRDVVVHPGAVGVIALDETERVLLVQQYRHPPRRRLWEPPAGLLDQPGEEPLDAARRELAEEAGYAAQDWRVLVDAFTSPGMSNEAIRIYLARQVRELPPEQRTPGENEEKDMPTAWVPLRDAVDAVLAGRLHNPMAVMGLLAAAQSSSSGFAGLRAADTPWPRPATEE